MRNMLSVQNIFLLKTRFICTTWQFKHVFFSQNANFVNNFGIFFEARSNQFTVALSYRNSPVCFRTDRSYRQFGNRINGIKKQSSLHNLSQFMYTPQDSYDWLCLPYQVKTQYLQILSIIDTSIKRIISDQSTPMVKGSMDIMFDMVDTAFSCGRALIVC